MVNPRLNTKHGMLEDHLFIPRVSQEGEQSHYVTLCYPCRTRSCTTQISPHSHDFLGNLVGLPEKY